MSVKTTYVAAVNTPTFLAGRAVALLTVMSFVLPSLVARVGESQGDVERRIMQPNRGKMYFKPRERDNNSREAERQQQREEREQPFFAARGFFPPDTQEKIYWKSAVSNQLSNDNGWRVHVFYVGGRSVVEAYRRVGEGLNEFEMRALLSANRGGSTWKQVTSEGGGTNGIGYDFETEDGNLRARHQGNWLMIFSTRLDNYVIEQQKLAKDTRDRDLAKQKIEQQNKAPESVEGF